MLIGVPVGYLIAYLAKDELTGGRAWFKALIIISIIGWIVFGFLDKPYIGFTLLFIAIVASISLLKSYDKKWTRKV